MKRQGRGYERVNGWKFLNFLVPYYSLSGQLLDVKYLLHQKQDLFPTQFYKFNQT